MGEFRCCFPRLSRLRELLLDVGLDWIGIDRSNMASALTGLLENLLTQFEIVRHHAPRPLRLEDTQFLAICHEGAY
jgi:hypothetical protein